jgi:hypothetical protein
MKIPHPSVLAKSALFLLLFPFFLAPVEARLILYLDLSSTAEIDVIMMDGKTAGYEITSQDTTDTSLIGKLVNITDTDPTGSIGLNDLDEINSILGTAGYQLNSTTITAYSTSIDGPAPTGGEKLDLKFDISRVSAPDPNTQITIAATRSLTFTGKGWFFEHFASGNATSASEIPEDNENLIGNLSALGGISTGGTDFELSNGYFNGGVPDPIDPETGLYSVALGEVPFEGTVVGELSMTLRFSAVLGIGDSVTYQGFMFATVPEPISVAAWTLVGGGAIAGTRRRRRSV